MRCICSVEPPRKTTSPIANEPETFVKGRSRKPIGSLSYATGMFGLLAAYETIETIVPLDGNV